MSFLAELQRRKVIRVAIAYIVAAWLLLQVATTISPILALPAWFDKLVLALLGIGFPLALILAWAFELTPDGVRSDPGGPQRRGTAWLEFVVLFIVAGGALYLVMNASTGPDPADALTFEPSVAVLPFVNLNGDDANEPLTAGIHSSLLNQLAQIQSLQTISRTTMLGYRGSELSVPEIAADLGVATILEGDVQRVADSVRINVQLIDAVRDEPLWTEVYDRQLTAANVFAIQSEIARAITEQLSAALSPEDERRLDEVPTQNIDALEAYFVGKRMLENRTLESLNAAIEYFETVVELDPNFALGWSGLADAFMLLPEYSSSVDRAFVEARAQEAVASALALNPDLPEVKASQAWHELRFFDWDTAEAIFRDAVAVAPDNTNVLHWLSHVLSWQGNHEEAIEYARHAMAVDPQSKMMRTNLAYMLVDAGEFDEGLAIARSMEEANPDYLAQRRNLFLHELRAGLPHEAADTFVKYTAATGGDPEAARAIGDMFIAWHERGEIGEVTDDLIQRARLGSEDLAQVLAFVGDSHGALDALEEAAAEHSGSRSVFSMKINPGYDHFRDDPRFARLLDEVGLAD